MEQQYWRNIEAFEGEGFRELMETYGQRVWDFAFYMTRRFDLADDVTQDVFLQAYRRIGTFRGQSSMQTWLLAITRNVALNYRRASFFRKVVLVDRPIERVNGSSPSAEQEAMSRSRSEELWRVVMVLPVKYREVLLLDAKYDLSLEEIASVLDIPLGTVKSRLSRARSKVTEAWKEEAQYERA
ncbi:MAG: RNA polymerase sigma factor [Candidatus Cohnella colombiensis]|uniref:RNA polymerase sigma factor n=1 Tax=Candidatus Cohnella colombiensis TaxID=3121368 RepID=A0AA95EZV0_9BACL|nr:MAG: RNA polymerase sigma factor [Cohnella sp.]